MNGAAANDSSQEGTIGVLIAYGEGLARAGLRALLEQERDVAFLGFAADGEEAVRLARETKPDVLLIDAALTGLDAAEVTLRITADTETSGVRVLVLGSAADDGDALCSLRAGASGFLLLDTEPGTLLDAVRLVAAGEAALSPAVVRRMIDEVMSQPHPRLPGPETLDELTAREREVMSVVAMGLNNEEIAELLVITRATAKTHVSRIMCKLGVRDRAQLVTLAYEAGLVLPKNHVATGLLAGKPAPLRTPQTLTPQPGSPLTVVC
jgi:DNA-binding NarL/FixJ family response regulator